MSKITIGIPTFHREDLLMQVLEAAKLDGILDKFPVIVLDDGPSLTLKRSISRQFPEVVFRSHEKNMGMARSLLDLLQACSTEYCMVSADDDYLSMNGLQNAESYVSDSSPDLVSTQWLAGNRIKRGRGKEGPITYSQVGQASYHAPGLIYKVETILPYTKFLERLLEIGNYSAIMTPQVVLAYFTLFHGGALRWHPSAPVVEGFAAPSQLKDSQGDPYNNPAGRVREHEGWLQFFQACDEWLPSESGRRLARYVGTLRVQELYSDLVTALEAESLAAGLSFRGGALHYSFLHPFKSITDLFGWWISRHAAHKGAASLETVLRHTTTN